MVDYYSRWFEDIKLSKINSESVVNALKISFAIFGIPEIIKCDRGLQFNSLLIKKFACEYDFRLIFSDPCYPQGNGCAERAVQTAKRLYRQAGPLAALMAYRTTPLDVTGCSPSQLLMGRNNRTKLPMVPQNYKPEWPDYKQVDKRNNEEKLKSVESYNKRKGIPPPLEEGQQVRIRLPQEKRWSEP